MKNFGLDKVRIGADNCPLVALPLEDIEMIRITLHYFYYTGTVLQPLKTLEAGQKMTDVYAILLNAETAVEGLLRSRVMPLRTCYDTGDKLLQALNSVTSAEMGTKDELTWWDAYTITSAAEKFDTVLSAELQTLDTYFVSQKAGYSTVDLIENAEILIPESIRQDISQEALVDFRSGGRCLAFELPTAAGFHLLRATESVLHDYYDAVCTKKTLSPTSTMGHYINHLDAHGGDKKVMAALKQITDLHRNPLMHPQDTLSMTQAIILAGIVTSAIAAMIEGIQQTKLAVPAAALATPATTAVAVPLPVPPSSTGTP